MIGLPWVILGKRYKYNKGTTSYIFIFTSYDENRSIYYFDFQRENSGGYWSKGEWYSVALGVCEHLFTLLDRPKIEDDPEYKELFV